jgi:hypothetical protein
MIHDGSLDVDNPEYMLLSQKLPLYSKYSNQVFRNHAKAAIADLVAALSNTGSKGESKHKQSHGTTTGMVIF